MVRISPALPHPGLVSSHNNIWLRGGMAACACPNGCVSGAIENLVDFISWIAFHHVDEEIPSSTNQNVLQKFIRARRRLFRLAADRRFPKSQTDVEPFDGRWAVIL